MDLRGFIQNIRTIAKTKELSDRLDKLNKDGGTDAARPKGGERSAATIAAQTVSNIHTDDPTIVYGPPIPGVVGGATNAAGGAVSAINYPPSGGSPYAGASYVSADAVANYLSGQNQATKSTGGGGGGGTNLAGAGKDSAPVGGSAVGGQAQPQDAATKAFVDKALAAGVPQGQIDLYLQSQEGFEPGVFNVADIMSGNAGPGIYYHAAVLGPGITNTNVPYLVGVTGKDPTVGTLSILARFDGLFPTPTNEDASIAGQAAWASASAPPLDTTWISGFRWSIGDGDYYHSSDALGHALISKLGLDSPSISASFKGVSDLVFAGGHYNALANYHAYVGEYDFSENVQGDACTPGSSSSCPIVQPHLTKWPATGTYVLSRQDGQFTPSPYDSEVPAAAQTPKSALQLTGSDDVLYNISPGANGGTLINRADNTGNVLYYDADMILRNVFPIDQLKFYSMKYGGIISSGILG